VTIGATRTSVRRYDPPMSNPAAVTRNMAIAEDGLSPGINALEMR